jgi:hypothetical protein
MSSSRVGIRVLEKLKKTAILHAGAGLFLRQQEPGRAGKQIENKVNVE